MRLLPDRGPWRVPAFRRVWTAAAVSAIGSRITRTALPVIAVSSLAASPRQAALLGALSYGPGAVVGLVAGGWVDRRRKRTLLVAADLVRAALVLSLPIAHAFGAMRLPHVYLVACIVGAATALFHLTELSYLPELVDGELLVDANGVTEATESVAEITGPALAGGLIRAVGAPLAVTLDALSYLWSAAFLRGLPDATPADVGPRASILADLRTGASALWRDPVVRRLALSELGTMIASGTFTGLYMLFALRTLDLSEATVGVVISFGGVGALVGALLAPRLARGRSIAWLAPLAFVSQAAALLIPAARGARWLVVAFLVVHQLVGDGARTAYGVLAISLRQRRLAPATMGRANAALQAIGTALLVVASLAIGELAEVVGLRTALWIGLATGGLAVVPLWPLGSLVRITDTARSAAPPG
ncbi:MAG TPA: MFS transporter [Kofleriaceae bacterium]|nr:MFS transporter [Kofleriaceae bacterium]